MTENVYRYGRTLTFSPIVTKIIFISVPENAKLIRKITIVTNFCDRCYQEKIEPNLIFKYICFTKHTNNIVSHMPWRNNVNLFEICFQLFFKNTR